MNAAQKRFIRRKLIPFILREHGHGFQMHGWIEYETPGSRVECDGILRKVPKCGTICCIGGSVQILKSLAGRGTFACAEALGLTGLQARGLFYHWDGEESYVDDTDGSYHFYGWPEKFATAFAQRKSAFGKARVAVRLLEEVIKTNGACLGPR